MFIARYRSIIDHLQQSIAILGPVTAADIELVNVLDRAIAILEAKIEAATAAPWSETEADEKILRLER